MPSQQKILPCEAILERYGKDLAGKTILITGVSNDSIAGELSLQLSNAGPALLILSARSPSRVENLVEKIKATNPNVATRFLKMDLGDLEDIRRAVTSLHDIPKIDHIAAVAGIMMPPYKTTVDGVESQFGVNYLANFLLVKLLLPKVVAAGPSSSIIIVASSAVRSGVIDFDDIGYSVSSNLMYFPLKTRSWLITYYRRARRMMLLLRTASPTSLESCLSKG
jgi:NAD(P)-dependent dehydrogenase (short-subunit alcohol dehydrogenase family)